MVRVVQASGLLLWGMFAAAIWRECYALNAEQVCTGTDNGSLQQYTDGDAGSKQTYYENLRQRYTNCTYVEGNLEITYLNEQVFDLSFLSSIREVTGYILILSTYTRVVPLTELRVIRGMELFENKYALYVAFAFDPTDTSIAIEEIWLTSLNEILNGEVYFDRNNQLCYVETIQWNDIRPGLTPNITMWNLYPERDCTALQCHESCDGHCWGPDQDHCQTLTLTNCSSMCDYRCRGPTETECCDKNCAGGCTGSTPADCFACRHFSLDQTCVERCPPRYEYDRNTFTNVLNPNFRYTLGAQCLSNCPESTFADGDTCVANCGPNQMTENNMCISCDGICPRTCTGLQSSEALDSKLIDSGHFVNCTRIDGNIIITRNTFSGDPFEGTHDVHPRELEFFSTVKQITGFLSVHSDHAEFTNLSIFRNLERIDGLELDRNSASLAIFDSRFLESLNLMSLTDMAEGGVYIQNNERLCYITAGVFEPIVNDSYSISVLNNKNTVSCTQDGQVCDPQCAEIGCWGPGPTQCAKCENAIIESTCIQACDVGNGQYIQAEATATEPEMCGYCNSECSGECLGTGPENCSCMAGHDGPDCPRQCRNVQDGPYCRAECPELKYANAQGICTDCHPNCLEGCNGPENTISDTGCLKCAKVRLDYLMNVIECMSVDEPCGDEYFDNYISLSQASHPLAGSLICQQCHPTCIGCTGPGPRNCQQCKSYQQRQECVDECRNGTYPDSDNICQRCHPQCRGCSDGTEYDCNSCRHKTVSVSDNVFYCAPTCPPDHPYEAPRNRCVSECPPMFFPNEDFMCERCHEQCKDGCYNRTNKGCISCKNVMWDHGCYHECSAGFKNSNGTCIAIGHPKPLVQNGGVMAAIALGVVVLLIIIIVAAICFQNKYNKRMYMPAVIGLDDLSGTKFGGEDLNPSNISPNKAQLKIIKVTEMKMGSILGSGAFGTVYKGFWIPEGEKIRIPVAIKALKEVSSTGQEELLEEAKVMASVDHPCVLRLLCICMADNMTLITQLMPLGSLLDYVREHKDHIGSHHLLNWSYQITQGMMHLEEKHLIHRDLAARNVLVQSPKQVKITDFGLAKFLEVDELEYQSEGGKMPIKWLAMESIQMRRFSHKSDVWSFGVTMWELMSFGAKPYEGVKAREVPDLLLRGERLPQPTICTIDIYLLMVKCWLQDEDSRPTFEKLGEELSKMKTDPQRYLVIQNVGEDALPNPKPSDFYKSILADEELDVDTDLLMDAEDYLQPMHLQAHNMTYQSQDGSTSGPGSPIDDELMQPKRSSRKDSRYCEDPTAKGEEQTDDMAGVGLLSDEDYLVPDVEQGNLRSPGGNTEEEDHDYQNDPCQHLIEQTNANLPPSDVSDSFPFTSSPPGAAVDNLEYHALMFDKPETTATSPQPSCEKVERGRNANQDEADHNYVNTDVVVVDVDRSESIV